MGVFKFYSDRVVERIKNHISKECMHIINTESIGDIPRQSNTINTTNASDNKPKLSKALIIIIASLIVSVALGIGGLPYIKSNLFNVENNAAVDDVQNSYQDTKLLNIGEIDISYLNSKVTIRGKVIDLKPHGNGHLFITVQDETGEILAPIFADKNIGKDIFILDDYYEVSGVINTFQHKLEVVPNSHADIRPLYSTVNIISIRSNDKGSSATIE